MNSKNVNNSFIIMVLLITVFYSVKVAARTSPEKPIFSEIVKNISRVNYLLQDLIKNYIQLEKLSRPKNYESEKTDTEVEELFDGEMNNRAEDRPTTKADKNIATPLYFSDMSGENTEDKEETEEKGETTEKEEHDNSSDDTSDSSLSDSDGTSFSDLTSKSDNSSGEILTGKPKEYNEPEEPKVLVIHLANSKNSDGKTDERKVKYKLKSIFKNKIPKSKAPKLKTSVFSNEEQVKERLVFRVGSEEDDVCTKAVMKKCSKALSEVLKDTCSKGKKCAEQFKDDFKKNSVTGCTNKFQGQSACRVGDSFRKKGDRLTDLKKQYLRMTCLRTLTEVHEPENSPDHPDSVNADPKFSHMNVLRDRYEKACQKKSYSRCREACSYAIIKTCKQHDCSSVKEKFMDRSCRKRCRESYKYTGYDSDDTDDYYDDSSD